MTRNTRIITVILIAATTVLMFAALWMVFAYAPDEKTMGPVQRIFYFHVPSAIVTFLSVFVLLVGSIGYLVTRKRSWDRIARASNEIGLMFCTLVLITGPIWAKAAWGAWWTWEARLTTTLVLWLLLASCLMLRGYAADRNLGARLAAVLGILAALDVPVIYMAVHWWRGLHPVVFAPGKKEPLAPEMLQTFLYCMFVFLVLFGTVMFVRVTLARLEDRSEELLESITGEMS